MKKALHKPQVAATLEKLRKGPPPAATPGKTVAKRKPAEDIAVMSNAKNKKATLIMDRIFDDAEEAEKAPPNPDSMKRAIKMGQEMQRHSAAMERLQAAYDEENRKYKLIAEVDLPALLKELDLKDFTLKDGSKIELKKDIACAITADNNVAAMAWLRKNKFGGLIKTAVSVLFPTGTEKEAIALQKRLQKEYDDVSKKEVVHPQTLKSFVKEQMELGKSPPKDLFSIHEVETAKLTPPKKGK